MENLVNLHQLFTYYQDKRVFVTGHTGFKGAWLIACLDQLGATVKGYALSPEYRNSLFDLVRPLSNCESVIADIRDKETLRRELTDFQPDLIFHLAAQPLVLRSYEIPAETFEINVTGTANLLEAATTLQKKCTIVAITTDKVYENQELDKLYREEDQLGGYDPYSASKACAELVVSSFRNSFFHSASYDQHKKAIASARAGNVIGGGDRNRNRIVPDIIQMLENNQVIQVRNPRAVRPWQHVLEPLFGYLLLAQWVDKQPDRFSKAYNFGPKPEDHLAVGNLVDIAIACWGSGEWKDVSNPANPHEAGLLKLDITKAMRELQWQPKLDAAEAIKWTIDWYKQPASKQSAFTFQQINEYLAL